MNNNKINDNKIDNKIDNNKINDNELVITTKFYKKNVKSDIKQTFGQEQLPKFYKCHLKQLRLNLIDEYNMDDINHEAIWYCEKK